MLLLLATLALAHDTEDGCPPTIGLLTHVQNGPLKDGWQGCLEDEDLGTPLGRTHGWIRWRDQVWRGNAEVARTDELLAAEDNVERVVEAMEALTKDHPELAKKASERAAALLAAQPFSVPRARLASRWSAAQAALDGDTARHEGALSAAGTCFLEGKTCGEPVAFSLPAPAAPDTQSISQCRNLGRLWARATIGGVYATDRDCVVRLAETLEGEPRRTAAHLALSMSWMHRDHAEAVVVAHHLAALLPDDPVIVVNVAELHAEQGDNAGAARWRARAEQASK